MSDNRLDQIDDVEYRPAGGRVYGVCVRGKLVHSSTIAPMAGFDATSSSALSTMMASSRFLIVRCQVAALLSPEDSPKVCVLKSGGKDGNVL